MCQLTTDKSIWLQILPFRRLKGISILAVSLSLMGCASLKSAHKDHEAIAQPAEREEDPGRGEASSLSLSSEFYLSISKPSEYELFLRSDLLEQETPTGQEILTEIWESGLTMDTLEFLESSLQPDSAEIGYTETEPVEVEPGHFHGMSPYRPVFSLFGRGEGGSTYSPTTASSETSTSSSSTTTPGALQSFNWFRPAADSPSNYGPYPSVTPLVRTAPEDNELSKEVTLLFAPPLDNAYILRGLNPRCWYGRGHCGVDMYSAKGKGDSVRAVEDGIVLEVGTRRRYGHYAIVFHKGGILSLYSHALEDPDLEPCQQVKKQEVIAKVGKSGNARAPHLHFEMIDLDKGWHGMADLDTLVDRICKSQKNQKALASIKSNLEKLIFRKDLKLDPLDYIPNIARNPDKFRVGAQRSQAKAK